MLLGLQRLALNLFRDGRLDGVLCLGGAEGAVLGASAMLSLPIGIPKIIVTPIASGKRRFGPLVGTRDVMVVHSVVDILGLNPISTTIFDNVAAAMAGMLHHGHRLQGDDGRPRVAITMLGNTTKAVMTIRDALARQGLDSVIFHSNGVGGPAMEELAADGLFVGVIDFTTDELADELVGGFHVGGPERLRRIGRLGLPQVVVPGCIDFTVHGRPEEVPARLQGRPVYTHNPEFTLVRTLPDEMAQLGRIFAERLNEATGPIEVMVPTEGLSIPNVPGGAFWDPAADAGFLASLRVAPARRHSRSRPIRATSTRPSSRSPWPSGSSRFSRRKEPSHDRARARQAAVEQHGRPGLSGHPGLPEGLRPGARADGQHRAARPAPAAVHRHGHGDRGRLARRARSTTCCTRRRSGPATRRSTWPAPARAAAPSRSARRRCRR